MRKLLRWRSFAFGIAPVALLLALTGCADKDPAPLPTSVDLHIPDRHWDPDRPTKVGWCGETCIQMAMVYYGRDISQATINQAGRPRHPDLWEDEIDRTLDALGVRYIEWDESVPDLTACLAWITEQVRAGHPVICGLKMLPDRHPESYVDHFVLAVGYTPEALLMNTNMGPMQQLIPYRQLTATQKGYSFVNQPRRYFARAITGLW